MYFVGDLHGNFIGLIDLIERLEITNSNLIQVGDFGMGFRSSDEDFKSLKRLNLFLNKTKNHLYAIRGNHDNPEFFNGSNKRSNVHLLPDYSILNLEGKTIFLVGGAISIDRTIRKTGVSYWEDEGFIYEPDRIRTLIASLKQLDIVVTHTAPSFAFPQTLSSIVYAYAKHDKNLLEDLERERKLIEEFYRIIVELRKPTHWYYGHFHNKQIEEIDGVRFCLLNEDEIKVHIDNAELELSINSLFKFRYTKESVPFSLIPKPLANDFNKFIEGKTIVKNCEEFAIQPYDFKVWLERLSAKGVDLEN